MIMKIFKQYKNLWMFGIIIVCAILFIVNFSVVVSGVNTVFRAIQSLLLGAMFAFVLNLLMDPAERKFKTAKNAFVKKHARTLAITVSILAFLAIVTVLISIVVPNMVNAFKVLTSEVPRYITELEESIKVLINRFPILDVIDPDKLDINWKQIFDSIANFITKGFGSSMTGTIGLVSGVANTLVNAFVVIVFAIYVLAEKERFVRLYYFFTKLYMKEEPAHKLTEDLRILNGSFKAFVSGELIEACILTTMCAVGMWILRLPYTLMIGVLVGVINMIPMIGAFIGGGIGAFIIFTISPLKCIIFLIFLCIIQQIESNVFFPRIIGNKVGLPGIYVMMTIVVGGSLFGVFGMVLGVPLIAALYKIACNYFNEKACLKDKQDPSLDLIRYETDPGPSCEADTKVEQKDSGFFDVLMNGLKHATSKAEDFFSGSTKPSDAEEKQNSELKTSSPEKEEENLPEIHPISKDDAADSEK